MSLIKRLVSKLPLIGALSFMPSLAFAAVQVSGAGLVGAVVSLIVFGVIIGLLLLLVAKAPFIPADIKQWINYFIYFVVIIVAINYLLGLGGNSFINFN